MGWLNDSIGDWIKQLFIDAIIASFTSMFGELNYQVQDIAVQVGTTPTTCVAVGVSMNAPSGARTRDPLIKSQLFYGLIIYKLRGILNSQP